MISTIDVNKQAPTTPPEPNVAQDVADTEDALQAWRDVSIMKDVGSGENMYSAGRR